MIIEKKNYHKHTQNSELLWIPQKVWNFDTLTREPDSVFTRHLGVLDLS